MYNRYHWCEMTAYEKITEARRVAANDRLALTADNAKRKARHEARSLFPGLGATLASVFRSGHPVLGTTAPAGRAD